MLTNYLNLSSETDVLNAIRIETAKLGYHFWRNNSGAFFDSVGRVVRFGLGNDSKQTNDLMKSSDLIGIGPFGRFWAIEVKPPKWQYDPRDSHERAQATFLEMVAAGGGVGMFATHPQQVIDLINKTASRSFC